MGAGPVRQHLPGGETIALFHYRIGAAIRSLVDSHADATILVVCHGGVIDRRGAARVASTVDGRVPAVDAQHVDHGAGAREAEQVDCVATAMRPTWRGLPPSSLVS
jgi:broad specificity phosphatase PhoE